MLCTFNCGQKPISAEITGPRLKPIIITFLNGHAVKMSPKYLCLYWLQLTVVKTEITNDQTAKHKRLCA